MFQKICIYVRTPSCFVMCSSCPKLVCTFRLHFASIKLAVGADVLTTVVMMSSVFWNLTPRSQLKTDFSADYIASILRVED
jgi:hypothetical protein